MGERQGLMDATSTSQIPARQWFEVVESSAGGANPGLPVHGAHNTEPEHPRDRGVKGKPGHQRRRERCGSANS